MSDQFRDTLLFICDNRGNEASFEDLYQKLLDELRDEESSSAYREKLEEIKEKQAEVYRQAKDIQGSAWPEFENFVSEFEKAVTHFSKAS